jgi:hypothetical protein
MVVRQSFKDTIKNINIPALQRASCKECLCNTNTLPLATTDPSYILVAHSCVNRMTQSKECNSNIAEVISILLSSDSLGSIAWYACLSCKGKRLANSEVWKMYFCLRIVDDFASEVLVHELFWDSWKHSKFSGCL